MKSAYRKRQIERRRILCLAAFTLILVFVMGVTFGSILTKAKESVNPKNYDKFYTSIEIQPGDTLWDLADSYLDENYDSKEAYINEVISINSLASEHQIVSGQYIIMPYYVERL